MVTRGRIWIYRGEVEVGISDLGYTSQEGVMADVLCI